jgi:hypothetical protein
MRRTFLIIILSQGGSCFRRDKGAGGGQKMKPHAAAPSGLLSATDEAPEVGAPAMAEEGSMPLVVAVDEQADRVFADNHGDGAVAVIEE